MAENRNPKRKTATRRCPVCGHEAWRIIYGMVMPDTVEQYPKTEFAGCVMMHEQRIYPATGQVEWGLPKWACQDDECRHRWW
ncbi:hypothetical protein [Pseudarthrobacter sp. BIM B-2242]|uniref:hypothetical protein n=1 Tax=Pseudarthrobacter sp. BIM B-2242 TaxID=2772401 RepID=UPI00168BFE19|nr:hypothetical protein [Pseudarthrobacter sp. BIM B-2242]QOD04353.1 hypothetical protein IDT60_04630 [Pseudarthrobacter sp. BIM B-2242]